MTETKDLLQDVRGRLKWMGSFPEDYVHQLADRIEGLEQTELALNEKLKRTLENADSQQRVAIKAMERIKELELALENIGKHAHTGDGSRTFDDTMRDLSWIDDECRAVLARKALAETGQ